MYFKISRTDYMTDRVSYTSCWVQQKLQYDINHKNLKKKSDYDQCRVNCLKTNQTRCVLPFMCSRSKVSAMPTYSKHVCANRVLIIELLYRATLDNHHPSESFQVTSASIRATASVPAESAVLWEYLRLVSNTACCSCLKAINRHSKHHNPQCFTISDNQCKFWVSF